MIPPFPYCYYQGCLQIVSFLMSVLDPFNLHVFNSYIPIDRGEVFVHKVLIFHFSSAFDTMHPHYLVK